MQFKAVPGLLALSLVASCAPIEAPPSINVVVGSDISRLDAVHVRLHDGFGDPAGENTFDVRQTGLPFSFAVVPPDGRDGGPPILTFDAIDDGGGMILDRHVSFSGEVRDGQTMYVYLAASCEGRQCGEGETCSERGCVPDYIPDEEMRFVEEGQELSGVCEPGTSWCRSDGHAVEACVGFGQPSEYTDCLSGQVCGGNPSACVPDGSNNNNNNSGQARLHVKVSGGGFGAVVSNDPAFRCEDDCTFEVNPGEDLQLQLEPASDSFFVGWDGVCGGAVPDCWVQVHGDMNVEARFELNGTEVFHTVEVQKHGGGAGRVYETGGAFDCSDGTGTCSAQIPHGQHLEVRAEAESGHVFVGWDGYCAYSPDEYCNFMVDGPIYLSPRFEPQPTGPARFDINGDGFPDAIYAAPGAGIPGLATRTGSLFVKFGPINPRYWMAGEAQRRWEGGADFDELGRAFSVADVTADGIDDILVGAPGHLGKTGAVYGIAGGPGLIQSQQLLSHPMVIYGQRTGEVFGASVTALGDFDGDGQPDIAIGAPGDDGMVGRVYIYLTSSFSETSAPVPAVIIDGEQIGDRFGWSVQSAGDLDQDGDDELLVGAPRYDVGTTRDHGRAYLFEFDTQLANAGQARAIVTGNDNARLGFSVTGLGDWQGDGGKEWAVSSHVNDQVFVFTGFRTSQHVSPIEAEWRLNGIGFFGAALSGFEDYNGDGRPDLVVGAPIANPGTPGTAGAASLFFGGGPVTSPALQVVGRCVADGHCDNEALGYTVGPIGDLDMDGLPELGVGSRYGGGQAGPMAHGRILVFDINQPGRPAQMSSYDSPWTIEGDHEPDAACAALSGGPAYWYDAAAGP